MDEQEREKLFVKNYQDNQAFIDKLTLTVAVGSMPLSIGLINNITDWNCWLNFLFVFVNACAGVIIIAHILGACYGKKSCDVALLKNDDKAIRYNCVQRGFNITVNIFFCIMVANYLAIICLLVYGGK